MLHKCIIRLVRMRSRMCRRWLRSGKLWGTAKSLRQAASLWVLLSTDTRISSPHRTVDPPSPRLLDVHRAFALIMELSGAGEYIEKFIRDMEELDVREDGSTHLGYLAGLRLGGWLDTLSVH